MAEKYVRKLARVSSHSYMLNIPKDLIKKFGWRERQKIEIIFGGRKHELLVRDWPSRRDKKLQKKK